MNAQILNPIRTIMVNAEGIEVRELSWGQTREFLKLLAGHAGKLLKVGDKGQVSFSFDALPDLIASTEELSNYLIAKATGKDAAWINDLPLSKGMEILEAAIALTLNDELLEKGNGIAGRLAATFGMKKQTMALPK